QNNRGYISRGYIYHDGFFKKMNFDIDMRADTMVLLNTNSTHNKTFHGYAKSDVRMKLRGPDTDMRMDIVANNPLDAKINLLTGIVGRTLGKAEFIEFKTLGREMTGGKIAPTANLTVNMNLNVTPAVEMKLIFDELAGDNITAKGNGNIRLGITSKGDVSINGNYTVESGVYAFSLQSWIRKTFDIIRGSSIGWTGDPYKAQVNIDAAYVAPNVNLNNFTSNLFDNNSGGSSKANLKVTAELREDLAKPKIKFKIGYAGENTDSKDVLVQSIMNLLSSNEDELNRQVAFLILFDRLLPYEQANAVSNLNNSGTVDYGINTISGLIATEASKYFKNLLEQIFGAGKGWDANIDFRTYSPGDITLSTNAANKRASSDIKISKSWFNERLTFKFTSNLDFGLGNNNQNNELNFAFLPNVVVEYKLNPNGSVVATVFHRQALDILNSNDQGGLRRLSTGAAVAWRKEGESIGDILGFSKRKKKKK
ncbi:MAG: translocation/assembly module TamB domain-containing protein, partial [Dinghuibacter sp.]|nr:translocation/assembly module TamB domain-containing protein [Dinghuibacter sp.]